MCGRITQKSNPKVLGLKIATLVEPLFEAPPRYNGAPSQEHWVIRQHPETGERTLDRLSWGLIPGWIKESSPKVKPINATAERVATAPMFRRATRGTFFPSGRSAPRPGRRGAGACFYACTEVFAGVPGLFLKAAAAAGSFIGWLGLVFCRDKPRRFSSRPSDQGCIRLPKRCSQMPARSSSV